MQEWKIKAEEKQQKRIKEYEERLRTSAKSWTPLLLSGAFAVAWTVFAPIYAVFTVLHSVQSDDISREQNMLIRYTFGILVVYLLLKFKWLQSDDRALRRAVESFGLHMFYDWLIRK